MFSRLMARWGRGRTAKVERRLREAACQPLEERLLLARTIYVDVNSPSRAVNGPTWETAYTDLQAALSVAVSGDTIKVADGTYKPTTDDAQSVSFQLKTGVAIYGGYAGYGAANPDARDVVAYPAILSGDIGTIGNNADNSYHVVVGSGTNHTAVLDGLTISGGNANGSGTASYGAGVYNFAGSPTLNNCTLSGNVGGMGGGMYNDSSSSPMLTNCTFTANVIIGAGGGIGNHASSNPTLTNCTFSGNSAAGGGGGMDNFSSSPMLTNCTFSGNSTAGYGGSGGGMHNYSTSRPFLTNCVFNGNAASGSGGGMYNDSTSRPTLGNCTFSGNSASSGGGGMFNNASSPTLTDCTFSGNSTGSNGNGGGMCNNPSSSPTLTNCTFSSNSAANGGGGMFNYPSASPTLANCTFSLNTLTGTSSFGGGMYNASSPTLTNCTFSGNSAASAGGMYNYGASAFPTLINCAFIGNSASGIGGGVYNAASSPTLTNCVFSGNFVTGVSHYGGGMANGSSSPTLINCIFSGNRAGDASSIGGGMHNSSSSPKLTNCTFSGNLAAFNGGGIFNDATSSPALANCTFSGNSASNSGGAVYSSTSATLTNCIVWGNTPSGSQVAGSATVTYSDIQQASGIYTGLGNINADPLFVRSPVSGADGKWGTADDDYGDLRLRLVSPAIDAGQNAGVTTGVTTDLAGNGRFWDIPARTNTGAGTAPIVDMGAFEAVWHTVVYVDGNATGLEDGGSWSTAYRSMAAALAMSISGQEIRVADGTYKPTPGSDRTVSFQLKTGVAVYGGYAGYGATNPDARDVVGSPSILSADIGTAGSNADNSYHVVVASGTDSTAVLDGFMITAGNANGTSPNNLGGGAYNSAGSPTIRNCTFSGNAASSLGGGVYNTSASPLFVNCVFTGNSAGTGTGVYNTSASAPTLINCTLAENSGVALYSSSASPTVRNCIIWSPSGTAIATNGGTATITYSLVKGGSTTNGNLNGDPQFVRNPLNADYGDLRLRLSSPAIDAAKNADVSAGVTTDLTGNGRFADIPAKADTGVGPAPIADMGAFEAVWHTVVYVDGNTAGLEDGGAWGTAYRSLAAALAMAVPGQEIRVADGTYKPTSLTNRSVSFELKTGVAVYGGYAGYNAANPDVRDVVAYPAILSGDIGTVGNNTDNSYHVIMGSGTDSTAILDGFTITAGNATSANSPDYYGGGMYNSSGSPTVRNCTFIRNSGMSQSGSSCGGGMYNSSSSPTLINCVFIGNSAAVGGGMYNTFSSPTLTNCTFIANSAFHGGGIYNDSPGPALANCIVWGNAALSGSQVYGSATVTYSDIQGGYTGTGNINADPLLVRSPWTGADGVFGTPDDDYDLHLRTGSPALDSGSNAAVPVGVTDLAGNVRIQNGTVDLGAYEGPVSVPVPKTIYVDLAAVGAKTGTSWTDAFTSLQSALLAATEGDTILIAAGIYKPTSTTDRTLSFALRNAVAIYGGYAGNGAPNPNARDVVAYSTVLSGDIGTIRDTSDNSYHVLTASGVNGLTVLDGITVTGGYADGLDSNQDAGGGLVVSGSSLTLTQCRFIANFAHSSGGGMYNDWSSTPTLTNCTFVGNTAYYYGSGMYNSSSSPMLTNCTFSGNPAYYGGGMYNTDVSKPILTNCILWGSGSSPIVNYSATPTITYSDIQGGYTGVGNINIDPQFVRAPWTGSDGIFGTADDDYGDLRLRAGSPALDIGSNSAIPTGITTDLAGNVRIQNGTVDLGAYEGPTSIPAPRIIYADCNAAGANNGVSWNDAFTSLQSALLAATDGDIIRVADGSYRPTTTTDRTISFALRNAVALYGGYAGYGAPNPNERDVVLYPTILSGDIGTINDTSDNSYHVLTAYGVGSWTLLDCATVTGGNANVAGWIKSMGGGLFAASGSPTLTNCTFSGNSALSDGGGMCEMGSSSPALSGCAFKGNSASSYGGGLCSFYSNATLTNCAFSGNSATSGYGGGMYNYSSSQTLTTCTFSGNSASSGGGMYDYNYYNDSHYSPTKLTNCTFIGDLATGSGGGMCIRSSRTILTNCTFSGNSAAGGGGMYTFNSSSPTLTNCIVWGNTSSQISQADGTLTITYSDIQQASGIYAGTGNINADPLFVRNPSAGTDGKWGTADDDYGDLRPQLNSAVIDAGNNAAVPIGVTTDLAGKPRFLDMPGVADTGLGTAPIVDMGAYERGLVVTTTASGGNGQFAVGLTADNATLQIWNGTSLQAGPTTSYAVNTVESCGFVGGGGDDTLTVEVSNGLPAIGVTFTGGAGNDALVLTGMTAVSSLQVLPGQVLVGTVAVACANLEAMQLDGMAGGVVNVGSLTVGTNLGMVAGKNLVLRTGSLTITAGGTLDLAGNSLILDYGSSPLALVRGWLSNGRMGISPGLKTSGTVAAGTAALGMVDNALIHLSSFAGQSLGGVFSQLLIQNTVAGDANLDGVVDSADYLPVIANMGRAGAQWFLGDLNGDGIVTVDDFAEVTAHVGNRVAAASLSNLTIAAKTKATPVAAKAPAKIAAANVKVAKTVAKAKTHKEKHKVKK